MKKTASHRDRHAKVIKTLDTVRRRTVLKMVMWVVE